MDKQPASDALVVPIKQTAPKNAVLVWHKVYHAQMVADRCSNIFQNTNQRESLSERDDEEED